METADGSDVHGCFRRNRFILYEDQTEFSNYLSIVSSIGS